MVNMFGLGLATLNMNGNLSNGLAHFWMVVHRYDYCTDDWCIYDG